MFSALLASRRFLPLFLCQFFSALNDNFLKNALVMLILFQIGEKGGALVTLAGAVLIAPFFLLSGLGGELADKHDKAVMAQRLKLWEIPAACVAALGLVLHSVPVLFAALAMFGTIASLFGPIKYGILPDHLETAELPAGNALVEGATFLAILLGTIAGTMALDTGSQALVPLGIVAVAVLCWLSARFIKATGSAAPDLAITRNPLVSTMRLVSELKADRRLWVGGLITSWFWTVGAVALSLLPILMKDRIGGAPSLITLSLLVFTIGIAVGSGIAAKASHGRPNLALVPVGAALMAVFALLIAGEAGMITTAATPVAALEFATSSLGWRIMMELAGLAIAGGLFIVPSFAAVQAWAPANARARVIAACNILNAAFMVVGSLVVAALQYFGVGLGMLFAILGVANIIATGLVLYAWGREGVQDVAKLLFRTFLRLEVKGLENIPKQGERVIIAPNHVSLLDAGMLHAILPSHAAFAIDTGMSEKPWVKPFLKLVKALPIDPTRPLAMRSLINVVKGGQMLVIFPEGRLTVTGGLMKVYDGTGMIADKAEALVVPVRIEGPERSPFGYLNRYQTKKTLFPKTTITFLPPERISVDPALKGKTRRQTAGAMMQDLLVNTAVRTAPLDQTLLDALVLAKRTRDTGKPVLEDPLGTRISYGKLILGAQVLGAKLAPLARDGEAVGVMLPNSVGVAVTFFGLQTIGRVPAMINFTAGAKSIDAACRAANISVILTSRAFIEKGKLGELVAKLEADRRVVYLEDVRATIGAYDKLKGVLQGCKAQVEREPDDPAVILFTSGSEGTPKGVVLSHRNLLANAYQCLSRIAANGQDRVFNVLPVFHSFGLTGGLLMPLVGGIPVYLYPTPLHYRIVPELVYGSNATILFGTDTFLNGYARAAHPYDFARVRLIVAGAEAVKDRTRKTYMEKFGVRILEGYGVTETAPVLALNTPLANKSGTVGRLAPLMQARLEPVPGIEDGGRLYVRGPNVMLGYLRAENPGVLEPPHDGWHDTGDIVAIDREGFITIKGRAKRFAKVGGEMVSLSAVEAVAAELWPATLTLVVAVPDARKGERLVLLTTDASLKREELQRLAKAKGLSELSVPAEIMVVPAIPLLGSGKPDYVAANALVRQRMAAAAPEPRPVAAE